MIWLIIMRPVHIISGADESQIFSFILFYFISSLLIYFHAFITDLIWESYFICVLDWHKVRRFPLLLVTPTQSLDKI